MTFPLYTFKISVWVYFVFEQKPQEKYRKINRTIVVIWSVAV